MSQNQRAEVEYAPFPLPSSAFCLPTSASQSPRALRQQHWMVFWLSVTVMVLASVMQTVNDRQVALPFLSQYPLPEICQSRVWLRMDCPGCGLTRSFIHFFHGRWNDSLQMHRFGWLLASLIVLQIPYRLAALASRQGLPLGKVFPKALGFGLIGIFLINWLLKLAGI